MGDVIHLCKTSAIQCFILQCTQITKKSKASMKPTKGRFTTCPFQCVQFGCPLCFMYAHPLLRQTKLQAHMLHMENETMVTFYVWCFSRCLIMAIILVIHAQKCTSLALLWGYCGNWKTMLPLNSINKNGIN